MPGDKLRLFVAVDVPRAQLVAVEEATATLRAELSEARWAPVDNQHLTVKFLGSTPADRLVEVGDVCRAVARAHQPEEIRLTDLGAFPSARRVRVLWVGVDDPTELLAGLAASLDAAFEPLGFRTEKRSFTAHLTLARWRTPTRVESLPPVDLNFAPFGVESINLYRSHLSPRGATYELLEEFPLG